MKSLILVWTLLVISQAHATVSQEQVDLLVNVVAMNPVSKFTTGPVACRLESSEAFGDSTEIMGRGNTVKEAAIYARLMCLKTRCDTIGKQMWRSMKELKNISDEDFSDFLRAQGKTVAEIQLLVERRSETTEAEYDKITCQTGTPILRRTVLGSCQQAKLNCDY